MQFNPRILVYALRDAWPVWLGIVVLVMSFWASWHLALVLHSTHVATDTARYAGTILQVLGIWTVAEGIRKTRKLFGRPSHWTITKAWFIRVATAFQKPHVIGASSVMSGGAVVGGRAIVTSKLGPDATVEQRVEALERELDGLRSEFGEETKAIRNVVSKLTAELQREGLERRDESHSTNRRLEELGIGGVSISLMGLGWLLVGVVAASLPDDAIEKIWRLL